MTELYYQGGEKIMAKIWKKLLLAILIVACLFNVVSKIVKRYSLKEEMQSSIQYMEEHQKNENTL